MRDDLDHALVKLVLHDRVVLCEKLRRLFKPLEKAHQPFETELSMVGKRWVTFLPWQANFVPVTVKLDLLYEPLTHGSFFLDDTQ